MNYFELFTWDQIEKIKSKSQIEKKNLNFTTTASTQAIKVLKVNIILFNNTLHCDFSI